MKRLFLFLPISLALLSCSFPEPTYSGPNRTFSTSFESQADFADFYIVPRGSYDSDHELSGETAIDGECAHKAWITGKRAPDNDGSTYLPHRAYPTIQLQKTENGIFRTPCLVSLWVNLDMDLAEREGIDDWFSFITLSPDASDQWTRTVLVNIGPDGYIRLMHVPEQGKQDYEYQAAPSSDPDGALRYAFRRWVRLDVLIDFDPDSGYAKAWQDGALISHARVKGGDGGLAQAHFGLYASAAVDSGLIYNDKLRIREVRDESEALQLLEQDW